MYTKTILASLAATVLLAAGAASAQTTSAFTVNAVPVPLAAPGLSDAILAIITFDATHASSSITVKSAPIQASFNGVSQSNFTNCRLVNIGNLQFLTGTSSASLASSPTINLDTPLVVPAGATARTFLLCATAPSTPLGGTLTLTMPAGSFVATDANGVTVTPTQGLDVDGTMGTNTGTIKMATLLEVIQSGGSLFTPGVPNTGVQTPLAPNTGAGGDAQHALFLLIASGVAAGLAALYIMRSAKA